MLFPHLILARTSSESDTAGNQLFTRRLRMWLTCEIEELFHEAEPLQKSQNKTEDE